MSFGASYLARRAEMYTYGNPAWINAGFHPQINRLDNADSRFNVSWRLEGAAALTRERGANKDPGLFGEISPTGGRGAYSGPGPSVPDRHAGQMTCSQLLMTRVKADGAERSSPHGYLVGKTGEVPAGAGHLAAQPIDSSVGTWPVAGPSRKRHREEKL